MKELTSNKSHKPPNTVKDAAGLSQLVGFLNDPRVTGAVVPKGALDTPAPVTQPAAPAIAAPPVALPEPPVAAPAVRINKVAFTGRFMTGKDHVAAQAGLDVFSLAEPLYRLQKYFFGTDDKTVPGAREFLQKVGQWGRGEVSALYPLSTERATFVPMIRASLGLVKEFDYLKVNWEDYGTNQDIWMDALLRRVEAHLTQHPEARVAVTNVRFSNEFSRLTSEGFMHFHCMTSAATWTERLKRVGLTPESPAAKDMSESLAATLDTGVTKQLSSQRQGNKLRAIWSDERVAPPSNRLLTVAQFVAMFPKP